MSEITFSDVMFEPQYSEIRSRSKVDLSTQLGKTKLTIPLISSNMKDITGVKMVAEMARYGCLGILHRFMSIEENVEAFFQAIVDARSACGVLDGDFSPYVGVSVGVKKEERDRFLSLYKAGAKLFCVDVAHGHSVLVKEMIAYMRDNSEDIYIIAGNIATAKAAEDLCAWGASAVKTGVGPGGVCITRKMTGVGVPQLHALMEVRSADMDVDIISDGGINTPGDVAKALKYADAVMIGSLFSGTTETPGQVYKNVDGQFYKTYGGSASGENKVKGGNGNNFVEGVVKTVPFKGHVKYIIREIADGLRSSFSYSGSSNLKEFQQRAILRQISSGARIESKF